MIVAGSIPAVTTLAIGDQIPCHSQWGWLSLGDFANPGAEMVSTLSKKTECSQSFLRLLKQGNHITDEVITNPALDEIADDDSVALWAEFDAFVPEFATV